MDEDEFDAVEDEEALSDGDEDYLGLVAKQEEEELLEAKRLKNEEEERITRGLVEQQRVKEVQERQLKLQESTLVDMSQPWASLVLSVLPEQNGIQPQVNLKIMLDHPSEPSLSASPVDAPSSHGCSAAHGSGALPHETRTHAQQQTAKSTIPPKSTQLPKPPPVQSKPRPKPSVQPRPPVQPNPICRPKLAASSQPPTQSTSLHQPRPPMQPKPASRPPSRSAMQTRKTSAPMPRLGASEAVGEDGIGRDGCADESTPSRRAASTSEPKQPGTSTPAISRQPIGAQPRPTGTTTPRVPYTPDMPAPIMRDEETVAPDLAVDPTRLRAAKKTIEARQLKAERARQLKAEQELLTPLLQNSDKRERQKRPTPSCAIKQDGPARGLIQRGAVDAAISHQPRVQAQARAQVAQMQVAQAQAQAEMNSDALQTSGNAPRQDGDMSLPEGESDLTWRMMQHTSPFAQNKNLHWQVYARRSVRRPVRWGEHGMGGGITSTSCLIPELLSNVAIDVNFIKKHTGIATGDGGAGGRLPFGFVPDAAHSQSHNAHISNRDELQQLPGMQMGCLNASCISMG